MKIITDNIKSLMALLIVVLAFAYFFTILFISGVANDQVIIAIVAMVSAATGYYYGSNTGNAKKDEAMASLTESVSKSNQDGQTK